MSASRGGREVLSGIDLAVPRGAIMGVIGPNGAGKTSLVSTICGFIRPSSGALEVLGKDMASTRGRELSSLRRRVGLLPQLSAINELAPLTVREVVAISRAGLKGPGRRLDRDDWKAVDEALAVFGMTGLKDTAYQRVSGGEQRKTQLARAFAQHPDLLVLDEPMSNLDANWQERLRDEIQKLWERTGITVFMVTHETHHLPPSVSHMALMDRGRVLAEGRPSEVLATNVLAVAYGEGLQVIERDGRVFLAGA